MAREGGGFGGGEGLGKNEVKRDVVYDPGTYKPYQTKDPGKFVYKTGNYTVKGDPGGKTKSLGQKIYQKGWTVYNVNDSMGIESGLRTYKNGTMGRKYGTDVTDAAVEYAKYLARVDAWNSYQALTAAQNKKTAPAPAPKPAPKPTPPYEPPPPPPEAGAETPTIPPGQTTPPAVPIEEGGKVPPPLSATPEPGEPEDRQEYLGPQWVRYRPPSFTDEGLSLIGRNRQAVTGWSQMSRSLISDRVFAPGGRLYR